MAEKKTEEIAADLSLSRCVFFSRSLLEQMSVCNPEITKFAREKGNRGEREGGKQEKTFIPRKKKTLCVGKGAGMSQTRFFSFPFYYSGNWLLSPFTNFARVPQPSLEEEGTGDVIIVGRSRCFHPFSPLPFPPPVFARQRKGSFDACHTYRTRIGRMKTCMP